MTGRAPLPPDHTTVGRMASLAEGWRRNGWRWLMRRAWTELRSPARLAGKLYRVAIVLGRMGARPFAAAQGGTGDTLTLFYDLDVSPLTFDCLWALGAAEKRRRALGLAAIRFVVVPGRVDGLRREHEAYEAAIPPAARKARIEAILVACARLAPGVSEILVLPDRAAAAALRDRCAHVYPDGYWPQFPRAHHPRDVLTDTDRDLPAILEAPHAARVAGESAHAAPTGTRRLVTITLREYAEAPARNSNMAQWLEFARGLDPQHYRVVFVPDTLAPADGDARLAPFAVDRAAAADVARRLALYETAWLNLFVNNGPYALCAFDARCRYVMLKILTSGVPQTEIAYLRELGFEIGGTPRGANPHQLWVWRDDDRAAIAAAFDEMTRRIEADVVANPAPRG